MRRVQLAGGGGLVSQIRRGSVGAEIGLEPGDRLLSVNGHVLRDLIDYRYYSSDEELVVEVWRAGRVHRLEVERDYDEDLGIEFSDPLFDGLRQCTNHCPFCFVSGMPRGLRRSLYLRDDDYRYSFLLGNYVTLTNLDEDDWRRIHEQRLSPLYVSIHATDVGARRRMLGNPEAPDILEQLRRLRAMGIDVHGQIVIVPGMNDGPVLRRSILELAALWPALRSLALVPVGLTRFHPGGLRTLEPAEAAGVLALVREIGPSLRRRFGRTWLYPSDELLLLAGDAMPDAAFYDDDAQEENGVGLVRSLLEDWKTSSLFMHPVEPLGGRITLVSGALIAPILAPMVRQVGVAYGLEAQLVPVTNRFFGPTVTVSGLLTGHDVLDALADLDPGRRVFLPRAMFDADGALTLDDLSPEALSASLGVPVSLVSTMSEVLDAIDGIVQDE